MKEANKCDLSDSDLKGDEDLADVDINNMNVDDILNEEDDFEIPILKNNNKIQRSPVSKDEKSFAKDRNSLQSKETYSNAKAEDGQLKISENSMKNWNNDDLKAAFGDSKMVKIQINFSYKTNLS